MYQFHFKSDCVTKDRPRTPRESDACIDRLLDQALVLLRDKGAYEIDLGLGPDTTIVRFLDRPLYYSVYTTAQLRDLDLASLPDQPYPDGAEISPDLLPPLLKMVRKLRYQDDYFYLREGGINVVSGFIKLLFSCGGYHIVDLAELESVVV